MSHYQPPFSITSKIIDLIANISEHIGRLSVIDEEKNLKLRRINRIRTIQGSLAIEGNTLSEEQITAILDGKRVIAPPKDVQEARNAIKAYEAFETWAPSSNDDFLKAHQILMSGLIDDAGLYRSGNVGVMNGKTIVHMAPPAGRVNQLMSELFHWIESTDHHPLITSCVFHYEFIFRTNGMSSWQGCQKSTEFIHPFADGNGRMGRLWQTLILNKWNPIFAQLPVESMIHERQADYYQAINLSTQGTDSAPFIEFMLTVILQTILEVAPTDQVSDQVSDQVKKLINSMTNQWVSADQLIKNLGLSHKPTFRKNYLKPALEAKLVEMQNPNSPTSPKQKYRLAT
ncbi:Fic family protein [Marinicellulosiphila megalodicopiae]|uniref:Fic family protein n=1 Tax=Marinicellulosiphila megalodicopiae TaxID=2724896 RepID=UPI003BAEF560